MRIEVRYLLLSHARAIEIWSTGASNSAGIPVDNFHVPISKDLYVSCNFSRMCLIENHISVSGEKLKIWHVSLEIFAVNPLVSDNPKLRVLHGGDTETGLRNIQCRLIGRAGML